MTTGRSRPLRPPLPQAGPAAWQAFGSSPEEPPECAGRGSQAEAAALARNDRYLREFVEALDLCPYARRCRETGKLKRRVLMHADPAVEPHRASRGTKSPGNLDAGDDSLREQALVAIAELEALPPGCVEVALLIFPTFPGLELQPHQGARAFERFCSEVRDGMARSHAGAEPAFFCVAFYPDFSMDLGDRNRAVRFIRRSPDPTLQLVRASVLHAVRGAHNGGSTFLDTSRLSVAEMMALQSPPGVSGRIAEANLETLRRAGPDALAAQLEALRRG